MKCALRHHENEHQRGFNHSWLCISGNLGGDKFQIVINAVLAAIIGKRATETLPAQS
jgi:hypothetical protein